MTPFKNGEGIWYARGHCYFTTKTDKRVWDYDVARRRIEVLFDRELALDSSLDAVDNVTVGAAGDLLVCEDGGNMEIGLITGRREVSPLIRFEGADHAASEVCGVCFDPSGTRLYCTSQRAFAGHRRGLRDLGPVPGPEARRARRPRLRAARRRAAAVRAAQSRRRRRVLRRRRRSSRAGSRGRRSPIAASG